MSQTASEQVATKHVKDRRELRFDTMDDILDDATAMATAGWRALGNWSLGQACYHLAKTIEMSIDGIDYKAPWYFRIVGKLRRNKMLSSTFPSGFKGPPQIVERLETTNEVSDDEGLKMLESAIRRFKSEPQRKPNPFFGDLSDADWLRLHCRHSELHLGFFRAGG